MRSVSPIDPPENEHGKILRPTGSGNDAAAWFCVTSQPKHEHIAAAQMRQLPGVEVFLPRIRFKRPTRKGPAWVTEALFPNYLFARFNFQRDFRMIQYARGVRGVVHFGMQWPIIPDATVEELKATVGADEIHLLTMELQPGDEVQICGGTFDGLQAVVSRIMPARQRVVLLLEFLGRQTAVQIDQGALVRDKELYKRTALVKPSP